MRSGEQPEAPGPVITDYPQESVRAAIEDAIDRLDSGKITDKWQVFAGYTYMQARQIDGGPLGKANDGNQLPNTPNKNSTIDNCQPARTSPIIARHKV